MKKFARWLFMKYYIEEITLVNDVIKTTIGFKELLWQRGARQALHTLTLLQDKKDAN